MSDTPRTDDKSFDVYAEYAGRKKLMEKDLVDGEFARQLERELNAAKAELAELKKVIRKVYYETETCADGAPDATDHNKLCNEIAYELKPFIHNKDI